MFFLKKSLGFPIASTNRPSLTAQSFECLGDQEPLRQGLKITKSTNSRPSASLLLHFHLWKCLLGLSRKPLLEVSHLFQFPNLAWPFWPRDAAMQRCTPRRWGTGKTWQINFLGPFLLTEFLARRRERDLMGPDLRDVFFWDSLRWRMGQPHSPRGFPT